MAMTCWLPTGLPARASRVDALISQNKLTEAHQALAELLKYSIAANMLRQRGRGLAGS